MLNSDRSKHGFTTALVRLYYDFILKERKYKSRILGVSVKGMIFWDGKRDLGEERGLFYYGAGIEI